MPALLTLLLVAQTPTLHVGVLAYRAPAHTTQDWQPMLDDVALRAGVRLELETLAYDAFVKAAPSLDVIITNPEHFAELRRQHPMDAIATLVRLVDGESTQVFGGVIFTRADAPFQRLEDLGDAKVAAVGTQSLGGYLLQQWELVHLGVEPRDFVFTGMPHDKVAELVLRGEADVGFVRTGVLEELAREHALDLTKLKVLGARADGFSLRHSTRLVPEWPIAASRTVPRDVVRRLTVALLQVQPDPRWPEVAGFAPPVDYRDVERLTREARREVNGEFSGADVVQRFGAQLLAAAALLVVVLTSALWFTARAHAATRRIETQRAQLLASVGEGVVSVDVSGRAVFGNAAAEAMFGYTLAELGNANLHRLTHHHRRDGSEFPESECELALTLRDGETRSGESWFFRKDGSGFPVWRTTTALRERGVVVGAVMTFLDLTTKNRGEEELARARDEAQAASAAKSRFLATMSHEVRTPLNGVLGMAQLLAGPGIDDAQRVDFARAIIESGGLLRVILDDLLDLSRVEAGRLVLTPVPMSPTALAADLQEFFSPVAARKGLTLEVRFDGPASARVVVDPVRLRQMVSNYLANALKFTTQGGVVATLRHDRDLLRCTVQDSGPGLSTEQCARLFQPFTQLDTNSAGGTGLGLAIVRQLARLMEGEVGVDSTPGAGSTFWFRVHAPATTAADDEATPTETAELPSLELHALVVDDTAINRRVLEGLLARLGCTVESAADGAKAVQLVCGPPRFDVIFMDCHMPVCDGYEATVQVRRLEQGTGRRVRIVALTASAFADDRTRCFQAGMDEFLSKPVSLAQLLKALQPLHHPSVRGSRATST